MSTAAKSKAIATWLALTLGALGVHRLYLHGLSDRWAWLHPLLAIPGLIGLQRMSQLGQDDRLAWVLMPMLGLSVTAAAIAGIVYGLTSDEIWNSRHNSSAPAQTSGWLAVLGVVACLLIGGAVLMATIAFSAQRYFEWQLETGAAPEPAAGTSLPSRG